MNQDRSSNYRQCNGCWELFAPITSDADDRYSYCCPECEEKRD